MGVARRGVTGIFVIFSCFERYDGAFARAVAASADAADSIWIEF